MLVNVKRGVCYYVISQFLNKETYTFYNELNMIKVSCKKDIRDKIFYLFMAHIIKFKKNYLTKNRCVRVYPLLWDFM